MAVNVLVIEYTDRMLQTWRGRKQSVYVVSLSQSAEFVSHARSVNGRQNTIDEARSHVSELLASSEVGLAVAAQLWTTCQSPPSHWKLDKEGTIEQM